MVTKDMIRMLDFIQFLADFTTEYEVYNEFSVTMNMTDVNLLIDDEKWEKYVERIFGADEVNFLYGDGDWVTVEFVKAKIEKLEECKQIKRAKERHEL